MRSLIVFASALGACAYQVDTDGLGQQIRDGAKEINRSVVLISGERRPCPLVFPPPKPPANPNVLPDKKERRLSSCTATVIGPYTLMTAAHCVYNKTRIYVQLPWVANADAVYDIVEIKNVYFYPRNDAGGARYYIEKLKGIAGDFLRTEIINAQGYAEVYGKSEWADLATIRLNKDISAAGAKSASLEKEDDTTPPKKPVERLGEIWGRRNRDDKANDDKTTFHQTKGLDGKPLKMVWSSAFPNYYVQTELAPVRGGKWVEPLAVNGDPGGPVYFNCDDEPRVGGIIAGMDIVNDSCGDVRRTFMVNVSRKPIRRQLSERIEADKMGRSPLGSGPDPSGLSSVHDMPWTACGGGGFPLGTAARVLPPIGTNDEFEDEGREEGDPDYADADEDNRIQIWDRSFGKAHDPKECDCPKDL
jgi:hypothetical protein